MRSRRKKSAEYTVIIGRRLSDLDLVKMGGEKLKIANEALSKLRMPDEYYKQIGIEPPQDYKYKTVPFKP